MLTVAQLACGFVANSLSLLGDGALMGMDGVCYAVSIYAERRKADARDAERADRLGALFSTVMLAVTSCWVLFDVADRLLGDMGREEPGQGAPQPDGKEVKGSLMVVFTAVNLVGDALVALACWRFGAADLLEGIAEGSPAARTPGGEAEEVARSSTSGAGNNMNIFGALAHLAADGVRGIAVLVCGILAVAGLVDPAKADAYCSLFVCAFVLAAAVSLLRVLLRKVVPTAYEHVEGPEDADAERQRCGGVGAVEAVVPPREGSPELAREELRHTTSSSAMVDAQTLGKVTLQT